jgi:hypothetical protein
VIEEFVSDNVMAALSPGWMASERPSVRVGSAIVRIVIGSDQVVLSLNAAALRPEAHHVVVVDVVVQLPVPVTLRSRQGATLIDVAGGAPKPAGKIDRALVRGVVLAKRWAHQLETGEVGSVKVLAKSNGLCEHYTADLLPLAYLAPDLVDDILHGRQPRALTLAMLTSRVMPVQWDLQRRLFRTLATA